MATKYRLVIPNSPSHISREGLHNLGAHRPM